MFSHCKSMGDNEPRGPVGRIYTDICCYTQNIKALGFVVSEKKIFHVFPL